MTLPNHIAGGIVFTGIFASFFSINILSNPIAIGTTLIASILPDIDHTKSLIGKLFLPLSRYLNRRFGHRTITHSITFLGLLALFLLFLERNFFPDNPITTIFVMAYISHLLLDMATIQGVPLFYPFFRNPCVLPGNPDLRFRTGNLRTESMIFCFFIFMGVFLQPLFKNGFWTQYNRLFGTPKHLVSEFKKSDTVLKVDYHIQIGTDQYHGSGDCIFASERQIVLLDSTKFKILDPLKCTIKKVIPNRSQKKLHFQQRSFISITVDSLNALIHEYPLQNIEIQSNNPFEVHDNNKLPKVTKNHKADYPENLYIHSVLLDSIRDTFLIEINPRIATLDYQIKLIQIDHANQMQEYNNQIAELQSLRQQVSTEPNLVLREKITERIHQLERINYPRIDHQTIQKVQAQIRQLRISDTQKYRRQQLTQYQNSQKSIPTTTKFTGYLTQVQITE
jgi:inner membrane protein